MKGVGTRRNDVGGAKKGKKLEARYPGAARRKPKI